ncbi:bi-domain-containing oxidoreductase [Terasakiella pusilla]|uniref:bi-domain-containing oxidoreductase n=1 Tax=Terasakiella pusilla TaxID=64973 RepID=UPI003AA8C8A2
MRQVFVTRQGVEVQEVPAPVCEADTVRVLTSYSCISVGTEMSGVRATNMPLWKRALQRPEQVKQVVEMVMKEGYQTTRNLIKNKLSAAFPTGYSACGTVIEVGENVTQFQVGDKVACAGAQCAHHAEVLNVPVNLCVPLAPHVSEQEASTVALGAIAMQGVRRLEPSLGETVVVIGLGFLGQLTVQMLEASGVRTIGIDTDHARLKEAKENGMHMGMHPDDFDNTQQVSRLTDGYGADGVIITAASSSSEILSQAFKMCRRKARVVLVGDVGLNIDRSDIYAKELDFLVSTSYGPGRYDRNYEEKGLEYPLPYIRWTENRNMSEYLKLISDGRLSIQHALQATFPIEDAPDAYRMLKEPEQRPLVAFLSYPGDEEASKKQTIFTNKSISKCEGRIEVAVIGAGGFAKSTHLPILEKLQSKYNIRAIMSRTGAAASGVASQYNAEYATTDYQKILDDDNIDAVFITTRHDTHADYALRALESGKHVMVEKPLCLTSEELEKIETFFSTKSTNDAPLLLTGFNRRFSKYAEAIKQAIDNRSNPVIINYRMNAGYIPSEHWVHSEVGGGRNLGEACHIYDLFGFLTQSPVKSVNASSISPSGKHYLKSDNFVATVTFCDGSIGTLTYTALGSKDIPKELADVYSDGRIIQLEDYKSLEGFGFKLQKITTTVADKGHFEELEAFADAILGNGEWPIPLWQQLQASKIALDVQRQIVGDGQ